MVYGQWPADWWNSQLQMTDLFAEHPDLKTFFHFENGSSSNCSSEASEAASHLGGLVTEETLPHSGETKLPSHLHKVGDHTWT